MARGLLLTFPRQIPALEALPEGTLLEPGQRVRYRGRLWRVAEDPCCRDPHDPEFDMVTLVDDAGQRFCLHCGILPAGAVG